MRILITGGAGFLGTHLVKYWVNLGHSVSVLNTKSERSLDLVGLFSSDVEIIWGNVEDYETVETYDVVEDYEVEEEYDVEEEYTVTTTTPGTPSSTSTATATATATRVQQ